MIADAVPCKELKKSPVSKTIDVSIDFVSFGNTLISEKIRLLALGEPPDATLDSVRVALLDVVLQMLIDLIICCFPAPAVVNVVAVVPG